MTCVLFMWGTVGAGICCDLTQLTRDAIELLIQLLCNMIMCVTMCGNGILLSHQAGCWVQNTLPAAGAEDGRMLP
jgi:hypothetical protein